MRLASSDTLLARAPRPAIIALVAALAAAGCAQIVAVPPPPPSCTAPCYTARGWNAYAQGDWNRTNDFIQAITADSSFGEAYMGLGYMHIEQGILEQASLEFQTAIDLDTSLVAAFAGNAYCLAAREDDIGAIAMAQIAIEKGGADFVFTHNTAVNTFALRVLLASLFFRSQDYESAQAEIDILVPDNTLSPGSRTYVAEMLLLLDSIVSGGG